MRLVIMGPPGCGKGTHAAGLAKRFGVPAISTGDLFRSLAQQDSGLGLEVKRIMASGDFVPDDVADRAVAERIAEDDAASGFVLDGYPRTVGQVAELDATLDGVGAPLDHVIVLHVPADEIVRRLTARADEQGRSDDTPQTIAHRIAVYERETEPIEALYRARGILSAVDGTGLIDDVAKRIAESLGTSDDRAPSSNRSG